MTDTPELRAEHKAAVEQYVARWLQRFAGSELVELVGRCDTNGELGGNLRQLLICKAAAMFDESKMFQGVEHFDFWNADDDATFEVDEILSELLCLRAGISGTTMLLPVIGFALRHLNWEEIAELASECPPGWEESAAPRRRTVGRIIGTADDGTTVEFANLDEAAAAGFARHLILRASRRLGSTHAGRRWQILSASE